MHYNYYCHLTDVNDHLSHSTVTTSLSLNCHINFMWLHLNCHIAAVCECIILSHNSDVNEGLSHFSVTKPMSTNAFDCHIINFMWLHQNCHINAFEPIRELHNRMLQTDNWQFQHLRNKTSSRRKFPSKLQTKAWPCGWYTFGCCSKLETSSNGFVNILLQYTGKQQVLNRWEKEEFCPLV